MAASPVESLADSANAVQDAADAVLRRNASEVADVWATSAWPSRVVLLAVAACVMPCVLQLAFQIAACTI